MELPADNPPEWLIHLGEIAERLSDRGWRLVTAESCTGGWLAKCCTDLPGSSRWYEGGVVSYSNTLKTRLLGVQTRTLEQEGAVSAATVREMAEGALRLLGGDVAVAVSGIAGPTGASPGKPVGTVWFAWAAPGIPIMTRCVHFSGDRAAVRTGAVETALAGLCKVLQASEPPTGWA